MDEPLKPGEGILHHPEGVDLMPADIQLSGMEVSLVNAMSRETILRQYLDTVKGQYSGCYAAGSCLVCRLLLVCRSKAGLCHPGRPASLLCRCSDRPDLLSLLKPLAARLESSRSPAPDHAPGLGGFCRRPRALHGPSYGC